MHEEPIRMTVKHTIAVKDVAKLFCDLGKDIAARFGLDDNEVTEYLDSYTPISDACNNENTDDDFEDATKWEVIELKRPFDTDAYYLLAVRITNQATNKWYDKFMDMLENCELDPITDVETMTGSELQGALKLMSSSVFGGYADHVGTFLFRPKNLLTTIAENKCDLLKLLGDDTYELDWSVFGGEEHNID